MGSFNICTTDHILSNIQFISSDIYLLSLTEAIGWLYDIADIKELDYIIMSEMIDRGIGIKDAVSEKNLLEFFTIGLSGDDGSKISYPAVIDISGYLFYGPKERIASVIVNKYLQIYDLHSVFEKLNLYKYECMVKIVESTSKGIYIPFIPNVNQRRSYGTFYYPKFLKKSTSLINRKKDILSSQFGVTNVFVKVNNEDEYNRLIDQLESIRHEFLRNSIMINSSSVKEQKED